MQVIHGRPPNWEELVAAFQIPEARVVITYGDTVYMPGGGSMYPDLKAHESVHVRQQNAFGVKQWWDRYIVDQQFRFEQELEAYRAQYEFKKTEQRNREKVAKFLLAIAREMSSPMYGNMVTLGQAMKLIRTGK